GGLWLAAERGVFYLQNGSPTKIDSGGDANDAFALAFEDRSTNLWAAIRGGSLLLFEGTEPFAAPITVPAEIGLAHCMKQDREGNLWVGTAEGLFQIRELLANTFV